MCLGCVLGRSGLRGGTGDLRFGPSSFLETQVCETRLMDQSSSVNVKLGALVRWNYQRGRIRHGRLDP
jgi:hypothetical protein